MKASAQRDDLDLGVSANLSRPPSSELERAFIRFRAGVTEKDLRCKRALDQLIRELLPCGRPVKIRGVNQSVAQRLAHHSRDSGITVTEGVHGDATRDIQ